MTAYEHLDSHNCQNNGKVMEMKISFLVRKSSLCFSLRNHDVNVMCGCESLPQDYPVDDIS